MISVIIPILNEEKTIQNIIRSVQKYKEVTEIIVVDDKSIDRSVEIVKLLGVKIITSTKLGKGASMRDGVLFAKNDIIVFLDGDIKKYADGFLKKITKPILSGKCDFVKTTFDREAGRVTELVAKPLLSLLFPKLAKFSQPLSGIIAGKKEYFEKITFEDDYGVDIGILIDMHQLGAKICEVKIGKIEHKMKMWQELSSMSKDVSKAILKRANNSSTLALNQLETISIIRDQMGFAIKESLKKMKKMVIFDMDDTILKGRFVYEFATRFGFKRELLKIVRLHKDPLIRTKRIANLMRGFDIGQIIEFVEAMPIVSDITETIKILKSRGYVVGIISDSYDVVAQHIKHKVDADFSLANELEFSKSVTTGEVKIPSFFIKNKDSKCQHSVCKSNALLSVSKSYSIGIRNIISVGDGEGDICMVKYSGLGVAFCSKNKDLKKIAQVEILKREFLPMLHIAL